MYVVVWEFVARKGREAEFESAYGKSGRWVELFRKADGYHGTELWRAEGRWVTVDRWQSEDHYRRFRKACVDEYEALDRELAELTERETPLGAFTVA